jgi:Fe-S cluster biogenesis protein NfuA
MMSEHSHEVADELERMQALIENVSAYIEQYHGGWVKLVSFEDNDLKVELGGACEGCPLTETTLHGWVAGTIRQFFPDVKIESV